MSEINYEEFFKDVDFKNEEGESFWKEFVEKDTAGACDILIGRNVEALSKTLNKVNTYINDYNNYLKLSDAEKETADKIQKAYDKYVPYIENGQIQLKPEKQALLNMKSIADNLNENVSAYLDKGQELVNGIEKYTEIKEQVQNRERNKVKNNQFAKE